MAMIEITRFPELDYVSLEGFNTLVTNLSYCGKNIKKIMVSSRYASEGKSYVTMNLMRTYARMGRRVVVLDCDMRASGIQLEYKLRSDKQNISGLSEYLSGHCSLEQVVYETSIPGAWLIPAGHEAPNPLQLIDTENMSRLVDTLAAEFDVVLIDTPPVGVIVDAVALAKFCDGALMVVGYGQGKQREIGDVVKTIEQTGCKVLGAVLNDVRFKKLSNRHYYYSSKRYAGYYKKKYGRRAAGREKGENGSAD